MSRLNLGRPTVIRICRIAVGIVLIAATLGKIGDRAAFASQIENYDLIPIGYENLLAITLPWVELVSGICLVSGMGARSAAWLAVGMMAAFTAAVGYALSQGLDIQCGCFGTAAGTRIGLTKLAENLGVLAAAGVASLRIDPRSFQ